MEIDYLKTVEIIGLLTGVAYVIGAILEKKWCWYFGIIATISYGISTYFFQLYGEFALQFFYLGISFYGLRQWNKTIAQKDDLTYSSKTVLQISKSSFKFLISNLLIACLLSLVIYYLLVFLNGSYPFWDAITSGFGIIATYLTTKKKIENWTLWIIIDIILSYILYLKEMPFYSVLYIIYTGFAILGLYKWKKELSIQKSQITKQENIHNI